MTEWDWLLAATFAAVVAIAAWCVLDQRREDK